MMTHLLPLLAFMAAAGLLTITPGVETAMLLRTVASDGARAGGFAAVGMSCGLLTWGTGAALGFSALVATSHLAFMSLKWAGALYLLWLGIQLLVWPRRAFAVDASDPQTGGRSDTQAIRRGFLTNMLNPKPGLFYVSFLPQFVPAGVSVAPYTFLLTCIHVAMTLAWFGLLVVSTARLKRIFARQKVVTWMDRLTGCIFIAFAVRLALLEG